MARPGRGRTTTPSGSDSPSSSASRSRSRSRSSPGTRSRSPPRCRARARSHSRSFSSSSSSLSRSISSRSRSRSPPRQRRISTGINKRGRSATPPPKRASPPRKASPIPESLVLHIEFLSRNVNEAHLKEIFSNFGEVVNVELSMDRIVNIPRGYGYVEFKKRDDAEKALLYMDGGQIDGSVVKVMFTLTQRQKASPPKTAPLPPKKEAPQRDKEGANIEKDASKQPGEGDPAKAMLKDALQNLMLMCKHLGTTFDKHIPDFKVNHREQMKIDKP